LLYELAAGDLKPGDSRNKIAKSTLQALSYPRQKNLIRYCLAKASIAVSDAKEVKDTHREAYLPSDRQLDEFIQQLVVGDSPQACISFGKLELRPFQGFIYIIPKTSNTHLANTSAGIESVDWSSDEVITLPRGGTLRAEGLCETMEFSVRYREGGERFQPANRHHHKLLRRWLQEWQVPTWLRSRMPLVYLGDTLISVPTWTEEQSCVWSAAADESMRAGNLIWLPDR